MTLKTIEDYDKAIAESDNRLAELEEKLNEAYAQQDAKNTERAKELLKHLVTHKVLAYFDNHLTLTNPVNGNNVLSFTLPTNGSARMYTIEHIVRDQSFENNLKVLTTLIETIKRLHFMLISPYTYGSYTLIKRYDAYNNYIESIIKQKDDIVTTVKDPNLTIEDYLKIQGQELDKNYNWHTDLLILALFLDVTFKSGYRMVAPYTHGYTASWDGKEIYSTKKDWIGDLVGRLYGAIEPTNAFFDDLEDKLVKELAKDLPPEKPIVNHPYSWTPTSAIWLADFKNAFRRRTGGNHQNYNRDQEIITNRLNDIIKRLKVRH